MSKSTHDLIHPESLAKLSWRQEGKASQCAHGNLRLIGVRLNSIIVASAFSTLPSSSARWYCSNQQCKSFSGLVALGQVRQKNITVAPAGRLTDYEAWQLVW